MARSCMLGGGLVTFISAKAYDLGVNKNHLDERVLFSL